MYANDSVCIQAQRRNQTIEELKVIYKLVVSLKVLKKFSDRKLFKYLCAVFNIITRKTLLDYCRKYPAAATALQEWYHELVNADFKNFNELKKVYGNASLVADDRVVFNIMGNKYRLVVRIVFDFKAIQVKWFGTHAEYDKIDVKTIPFKKK